jgi:hypothetical protein
MLKERLSSPIIIIGAGRSGSSVLDRILNAHPEITMLGEFQEIVPIFWHKIWNCEASSFGREKRLFEFLAHRKLKPIDDLASSAIIEFIQDEERSRLGKIIREMIDVLFDVSLQSKSAWGFKEIWIPSNRIDDWAVYDAVFPRAQYLHIIRNPFEFARSVADWHQQIFDCDALRLNLNNWLEYRAAGLARVATRRYFRIKYEDLIHDTELTLTPFLERIGLEWHSQCAAQLATKVKPSSYQSGFPPGTETIAELIPGLSDALLEEGYDNALPKCFPVRSAPRPAATRLSDRTWTLNPPFLSDDGFSWISKLYTIPELVEFAGSADRFEAPQQSRLILLENGAPLGRAHSLHATIRCRGGGAYSHWGEQPLLYFSSSDNSDPNANKRTYCVELVQSL